MKEFTPGIFGILMYTHHVKQSYSVATRSTSDPKVKGRVSNKVCEGVVGARERGESGGWRRAPCRLPLEECNG